MLNQQFSVLYSRWLESHSLFKTGDLTPDLITVLAVDTLCVVGVPALLLMSSALCTFKLVNRLRHLILQGITLAVWLIGAILCRISWVNKKYNPFTVARRTWYFTIYANSWPVMIVPNLRACIPSRVRTVGPLGDLPIARSLPAYLNTDSSLYVRIDGNKVDIDLPCGINPTGARSEARIRGNPTYPVNNWPKGLVSLHDNLDPATIPLHGFDPQSTYGLGFRMKYDDKHFHDSGTSSTMLVITAHQYAQVLLRADRQFWIQHDRSFIEFDRSWSVEVSSAFYDVVLINVPTSVWSGLGCQALSPNYSNHVHNSVLVYALTPEGRLQCSTGPTATPKVVGALPHRASTPNCGGASGSPLLSGASVIGIHHTGSYADQLNLGTSVNIFAPLGLDTLGVIYTNPFTGKEADLGLPRGHRFPFIQTTSHSETPWKPLAKSFMDNGHFSKWSQAKDIAAMMWNQHGITGYEDFEAFQRTENRYDQFDFDEEVRIEHEGDVHYRNRGKKTIYHFEHDDEEDYVAVFVADDDKMARTSSVMYNASEEAEIMSLANQPRPGLYLANSRSRGALVPPPTSAMRESGGDKPTGKEPAMPAPPAISPSLLATPEMVKLAKEEAAARSALARIKLEHSEAKQELNRIMTARAQLISATKTGKKQIAHQKTTIQALRDAIDSTQVELTKTHLAIETALLVNAPHQMEVDQVMAEAEELNRDLTKLKAQHAATKSELKSAKAELNSATVDRDQRASQHKKALRAALSRRKAIEERSLKIAEAEAELESNKASLLALQKEPLLPDGPRTESAGPSSNPTSQNLVKLASPLRGNQPHSSLWNSQQRTSTMVRSIAPLRSSPLANATPCLTPTVSSVQLAGSQRPAPPAGKKKRKRRWRRKKGSKDSKTGATPPAVATPATTPL